MQRLIQHGPDTATRLAATSAHSSGCRQAPPGARRSRPRDTERDGREVRYVATPEPLTTAVAWLLEASPHWDRRLERLRQRAQERAPSTCRASRRRRSESPTSIPSNPDDSARGSADSPDRDPHRRDLVLPHVRTLIVGLRFRLSRSWSGSIRQQFVKFSP